MGEADDSCPSPAHWRFFEGVGTRIRSMKSMAFRDESEEASLLRANSIDCLLDLSRPACPLLRLSRSLKGLESKVRNHITVGLGLIDKLRNERLVIEELVELELASVEVGQQQVSFPKFNKRHFAP